MEDLDDGLKLRRERGCAVLAEEEPGYEFVTPRETRQISRQEKRREWKERRRDWPWEPLVKENDLTSWEPLLEPGPSVSEPGEGKTYCVGTYLDDVFGYFITFQSGNTGRRAHPEARYVSNKEEAVRAFEKKRRIRS